MRGFIWRRFRRLAHHRPPLPPTTAIGCGPSRKHIPARACHRPAGDDRRLPETTWGTWGRTREFQHFRGCLAPIAAAEQERGDSVIAHAVDPL